MNWKSFPALSAVECGVLLRVRARVQFGTDELYFELPNKIEHDAKCFVIDRGSIGDLENYLTTATDFNQKIPL